MEGPSQHSDDTTPSGGKAPACGGFGAPVEGIAGIVFDVPDVLYDATLWRRWLFQLIGRLGIRVDYHEFCRRWDAQLVDVYRGRRELSEALESFLLACGLSWAQVDEIEAASRIQHENLELGARPLPGVARTIRALGRRGVPMAAWADVPHTAAKLAERLERIMAGARFSAVLTSFDLEIGQPAAECYEAAVRGLGLAPEQIVYVGHETTHLAGAREAGLRTAAFNFEPQARADFFLTRFDELLELVGPGALVPGRSAAG